MQILANEWPSDSIRKEWCTNFQRDDLETQVAAHSGSHNGVDS